MGSTILKYLYLTLITVGFSFSPAFSQASEADKIELAVRKANVINKQYPLHAVVNDREAMILTRRHPHATDDDMRIDSILITKSVLDSFTGGIDTVKVLFRDEDASGGKCVLVTANDIKEYATGSMEPKKFLATIAVNNIGGDDEVNRSKISADESKMIVSPGPFEEKRLLLMDRINTLRRKGTGVAPFEAIFAQIDQLAKAGRPAPVRDAIGALGEELSQQEDMVRQASRTGAGHGISHIQGSQGAKAGLNLKDLTPENRALVKQIVMSIHQHRGEHDNAGYWIKLKGIVDSSNVIQPDKIKSQLIILLAEITKEHGPSGPSPISNTGAGQLSPNRNVPRPSNDFRNAERQREARSTGNGRVTENK